MAETRSFGTLLRRFRLAAGLTQEELAERARLSVRGISDLERGVNRTARLETVRLLARALALSTRERDAFEGAARNIGATGAGAAVPEASPAAALRAGHAPASLVGRAREVSLLAGHLGSDGPPVLMLTGEPGIGKTRLLQEAERQGSRAGLRVLHGGCGRRGGQEPYAPLLEALERHVRAVDPLRLRTELRGCAWLVRLLPELAAGPIEALPSWTLTAEQERRLIFAAVERFLTNVAGPGGTLLVLDDLQWASADALDLLAVLARSAGEARLRVVGAYRSTEVEARDPLFALLADLAAAGLVCREVVSPLTLPEAHGLLEAMLEGVAIEPQMREQLVQRADGVPFFLVSLAQNVRQARNPVDGGLPWTIQQSVGQRMAMLPDHTRTLLGMAAVGGRHVPRALLAILAECEEREVIVALDGAVRLELLREAGPEDYQFTHDLIREVILTDVGLARRLVLHRAIAVALEDNPRLWGATKESRVEALAYHSSQGTLHDKAARWLEQAGDNAAAGFANATAAEHYLSARNHAVAAGADRATCTRLETKVGDTHVRLGEYGRAQEEYARARAGETDPVRRAQLRRKEGDTLARQGNHTAALALYEEGAHEGPPLPGSIRAALVLSQADVHLRQHNYDAAQSAAQEAVAILHHEAPGQATDMALARAYLHHALVAHHRDQDNQNCEQYVRHSLALAESGGDPALLSDAWKWLGMTVFDRGDTVQAEACLQQALAIAAGGGEQGAIVELRAFEGIVAMSRGAMGRAEECFRESLALAERMGDQSGIGSGWSGLGWIAWTRGDLAPAESHVQRALKTFDAIGDQFGSVWCWTDLGRIALDRGHLATAVTTFRHARRWARQIGDLRLQGAAALGQARARLSAGRVLHAVACLEHTRVLLQGRLFAETAVSTALVVAEVTLARASREQEALAQAYAAADEAVRLAASHGRRREEALARHLLGQCALGQGTAAESEHHLRAALSSQVAIGVCLDAARTRVTLATLLGIGSEEGRTLLAEAREQFAASGADLDLAHHELLVGDGAR